jgi:hypothetical protein
MIMEVIDDTSESQQNTAFQIQSTCQDPVVQRNFVTILALNQLDLTERFNAKIN